MSQYPGANPPVSVPREINVGLMGLGVVGTGVASALLKRPETISRKIGCPVNLKKVLVRDLSKDRSAGLPLGLLGEEGPIS